MGDEKVISGGKRANLAPSEWQEGIWIGFGKDDSCQFEASWDELVDIAEKILAHPNTKSLRDNKEGSY